MKLFPENYINILKIHLCLFVCFFEWWCCFSHLSLCSIMQPAAQPSCLFTASVFGLFRRAAKWCDDNQSQEARLWQCNARAQGEERNIPLSELISIAILKFQRLPRVQFSIMCIVGSWENQGWGWDVSEGYNCYQWKGTIPE